MHSAVEVRAIGQGVLKTVFAFSKCDCLSACVDKWQ